MEHKKSYWRIISATVGILTLTTFCSLFQCSKETPMNEGEVTGSGITTTYSPSPTLVPTNLVKLQDDGAPLPPQVMGTNPEGGSEISANGVIQIHFDQPMDQNTTSTAWSLLDSNGAPVTGTVSWPAPDMLQFSPSESFTPGANYQGILSDEATSTQKIPLNDTFYFDIKVASNLMISQVFPADGAVEVENNAVLTVIFNRPVVPLMTVEDQGTLVQPLQISPPVAGNGEWLNTSVYVYHPEEAFASSTTYNVSVAAGLQDTIGSKLQETYQWQFTTIAPSIDSYGIAGPTNAYNPEDNYPDVRLESYFLINFRQPMNESSVAEAFTLSSLQGDTVPVTLDWSSEYSLLITPTQQLALGTDYTLLLTTNALASTGGKLADGLHWNFRTLPYPGIKSTYPVDGSTQTYFSSHFELYFNSPMNLETIKDRVVIKPELPEELSWYYNDWGWSVDFYGLQPSTNYFVTVLPGMEDIYGNPITESFTFKFRTADRSPAAFLDLPYAPSIYRVGGPMDYYVSYVNVKTVDVHLYQVPASYFVGFNNGTYDRWNFVPSQDWLVNHWNWVNDKKVNEITSRGVHLTTRSGDPIEPGFYFMTIVSPQVESYSTYLDTRLLVVAEANLTFKTTQTEGLMWLTDLNSGEPMEKVTLVVYDNNFQQIGTGATNSDGLLYLELPVPEEVYSSRYVMTNEGEPLAFALSDWGSGVSPYDFGIWSDYYSISNQPVAYVYTDRPLYRPGEPVSFKGILRQNDDLAYSLLPWSTVEVEIYSYNETVYQDELTLSKYGTFDGEFTLAENAALGYYSIMVRPSTTEDSIGGVGFSVAEYRKPEFQVTTTADPEAVLAGNEFNVDVMAEYFSGGGVADAEVSWALQAADYYFQPQGELSTYTFVDYDRDTDFYNDYYGASRNEIVANGITQTDQNGIVKIPLTADLSESGNSRQFTFEATVTDIAGTSVSDRVSVVAHQATYYPGVRSQQYVGLVGAEQAFDLVVVNWDGDPVPGVMVDVEIVERRWYSVQEQDTQGFVHWTSTVEEIPEATFNEISMDSNGKAEVSFVPDKGGVYKAKVTIQDEYGNQAISGAYTWVSSSDYVVWRQTDDRRIELIVDKDSYQPGDVAEILIASPFKGDNYALVTVERGHIREQDVIRLASNSAIYRLPITADMAPNVYVSVIVIQGANNGDKPDFRMGMAELSVNREEQAITVEITPDKEQAGPGDEVTYAIKTTDYQGNPVKAEVSLALADLATLSLTQPNSIPILDYFYDQRSLGVQTTVPIVYSIEYYISTLEDRLTEGEGMGSGGGKGADVYGVFNIRGDFRDTAFWKADVITDENGEASVTVTLPDNLTIWRMDARAVTLNTLVGDGEDDLQSTKPLLIRPQTPRFFVIGDHSTLGAAVHNNTGEDLSVNITLQATGMTLNTSAIQSVDISAGSQAYVTWDVIVENDVDRVDLVFMAKGGKYSDASRPTMGTLDNQGIPVYKYEVPETVGTSGSLTEAGSRTEGITIPAGWDVSHGDLIVKISPSLVAGMTDGLDYLEHYPYECIEQTISRFLPNVLTNQALDAAGLSDPELRQNLKEQVNIALQRLYNWQRPDGGWGWWPEALESDPLTSAYVVFGLVEAKNSGYQVNPDTLTRAINYLKGSLQTLGSLDRQYHLNRQAFILYVLAKSGEPQVSLTGGMFDLRQSLSLYARAYLAEALWQIDPEDPRLDTLISDLVNAAIMSATGIHWQEDWQDYWNWNTDTRTTAIVLSTIIQIDPQNELNTNAVRWLMTNRTEGHWRTTQETAWTLMSLTKWMVASGELQANYDWAVGLNGTRLGDGAVDRQTIKETWELKADITDLFMDEVNRLTVARDEGPGSLYYTAHLNVYLPVDQIQPLDRGIIISREYFNPSVEQNKKAISQAGQGELLLARLTIVVPNDTHYLIINDFLPAGLEAVDQSLETSPEITAPERYDYDSLWRGGWGWWYFDHVELRDERIVISADYLPAGTYVYTYIVRASTPGTYYTIPPTAQEFYFPEVYGRGAGGKFIVEP